MSVTPEKLRPRDSQAPARPQAPSTVSARSSATQDSGAERPRKILLLNYEYTPMGGGAGNATRQTARHLAARGHTVHVLTARLRGQPASETVEGVVIWRVPTLRRSLLECGLIGAATYLVFAFFRLIRLARTFDYDLYQFYFGLPTGVLALYVRWVLKKPYVIALRGSDVPGYDNSSWFMAPLHWILRPLSRYLWRNAGARTVLSEGLRKLARETLPDADFKVIPNGVDEERFPQRAKRQGHPKIRLITVCRMVNRKGLQYLIEAMEELQRSDIELWLIGDGKEYAQITELVRRRKLDASIWLLGYVGREKLHEYYQDADIFVLPSLSESFGQVLLEAMGTGLPVVATTTGGIPEIVEQGRGGVLVPPGDAGAIVDAVRSLSAEPERLVEMGRYNATRVRERFNWGSVARDYETLYNHVLGENKATPVSETGRFRQIES